MADILGPYVLQDGDAEAVAYFELYSEGFQTICGLLDLRGRIPLRPKQWLHTVRLGMRELEDFAREAGCTEMRVAGRDWSRVLPDYERYHGPRHGLRKRLV